MSALVAPLAIDPGLAIYLPATVRVTADQEPGQHVLAHRLGGSGMVHGGEQPERRLGRRFQSWTMSWIFSPSRSRRAASLMRSFSSGLMVARSSSNPNGRMPPLGIPFLAISRCLSLL